MSITLMQMDSDTRELTKHIVISSNALNCNFKKGCSLINPIVEIDGNSYNYDFNYCYISDFQRYYYINNVISETGGIAVLECSVDVLQSHAGDINKTSQLISRYNDKNSDFLKNNLVIDNNLPLGVKTLSPDVCNTNVGEINNITDMLCFVLTVMGGSGVRSQPEPPEPEN